MLARFAVPVAAIALLSSSTALAQEAGEREAPQIFAGVIDLYAPAVAQVQSKRDHQAAPISGFFTGPGRLITSRSALLGAKEATVTLDTGDSFPIGRILGEDRQRDLALAEIEIPPALMRGLRLDPIRPIPGEDALVIGQPRKPGEGLTDHAFIETKVNSAGGDAFTLAAPVPETMAGSPVLNIEGQTIGAITRRPDGVTEFVPVRALLDLAETPGLPFAEWAGGKSLPDPGGLEAADLAELRDLPRPEGFDPPPEKFEALTVIPARIERDGDTIKVDGRYTMTGAGAPADPYIISWDQLISAGQTLQPRQGRRQIPERVTMLHGKYVRLTGAIAFPMAEPEPRDLLLMLNQWDGCCIGVPPTPFDAIEVRLRDVADENERFAVYGTITGKLQVSPYMVGDWLYGLYIMDNATISLERVGGIDQ
jgi:hypothetical protein